MVFRLKLNFPRCTTNSRCNAKSASNALNKWLHANSRKGIVICGFRHAMRESLRAVCCPSEMLAQIGGWSKRSVSEGIGEGCAVESLLNFMHKICLEDAFIHCCTASVLAAQQTSSKSVSD